MVHWETFSTRTLYYKVSLEMLCAVLSEVNSNVWSGGAWIQQLLKDPFSSAVILFSATVISSLNLCFCTALAFVGMKGTCVSVMERNVSLHCLNCKFVFIQGKVCCILLHYLPPCEIKICLFAHCCSNRLKGAMRLNGAQHEVAKLIKYNNPYSSNAFCWKLD